MSHATGHAHEHHFEPDPALFAEPNVRAGGAARGLSLALIIAGLALGGFVYLQSAGADKPAMRVAMLSYHTGFLASIAFFIGALGFVMILHQTAAGWSAVIRRQFENLMSLAPVGALLFLPTLVLCYTKPGLLWKWMDPAHVAGDVIFQKKQAFLNLPFFTVRALAFFAVWAGFAFALRSLSLRQDADGDRWKTRTMRKISAPGLLLFALATAFAGFDWGMALDFHFFSTMWGVYFFAQSMLATLALGTLTLIVLRSAGRLEGLVRDEHFHDLGKLLFGFTIFWAYISFSQYFLIWYANIPEETSFMMARREHGWLSLSSALVVGKFVIPFLALLPRPNRRSMAVLPLVCVWILGMHLLDLFWVVQPELTKGPDAPGPSLTPVVIAGILSPLCVMLGAFLWRIASVPLVPLQDPRLPQSLTHRNSI